MSRHCTALVAGAVRVAISRASAFAWAVQQRLAVPVTIGVFWKREEKKQVINIMDKSDRYWIISLPILCPISNNENTPMTMWWLWDGLLKKHSIVSRPLYYSQVQQYLTILKFFLKIYQRLWLRKGETCVDLVYDLLILVWSLIFAITVHTCTHPVSTWCCNHKI